MFRRVVLLAGIGVLTLASVLGEPGRAEARPGRWFSRSSVRYVPQRASTFSPYDRGNSRYTYPP